MNSPVCISQDRLLLAREGRKLVTGTVGSGHAFKDRYTPSYYTSNRILGSYVGNRDAACGGAIAVLTRRNYESASRDYMRNFCTP